MNEQMERQLASKTDSFVRLASNALILALCLSGLVLAQSADGGKLRIIVFGAHPDDCEFDAGGTAAMWAAQGHHVKFVSTTNGDIGHATMAGGPLAKRRTAEVEKAAKILGIDESQVFGTLGYSYKMPPLW